jgi:hypothetical protein
MIGIKILTDNDNCRHRHLIDYQPPANFDETAAPRWSPNGLAAGPRPSPSFVVNVELWSWHGARRAIGALA